MGYSGFSQFWCKNGHYWTVDCWREADVIKDNKCPICKESAVFRNMVNVTNGSFDDEGNRIDGYIKPELVKEHKTICKSCGKEHVCECSIYKIPKKEK